MKDSLEEIRKREEELEKLAFGTPSEEPASTEETTEPEVETEEAPVKEEGKANPEPKPVEDEQPKVQTEDWEKRYKNLRASRDEKLYQAKSQLSAALSTINTLQAQLDELRSKAPQVDPLEGVFTDEDTENLGEATVEAMRRVTRKATEAATAPLQKQLEAERKARAEEAKRMAEQSSQEAYNIFLSRIANAVPDWEDVNYDPDFMKWMEGEDVDGTQRKTYFAAAEASGNSALIIRYMNEFKQEKAAKVDPLADKVTPTGEDAGANTENTTKPKVKTISRAYINQFYDDLNRGKYKGRYSEAQAIEAEIDRATREGRIVA